VSSMPRRRSSGQHPSTLDGEPAAGGASLEEAILGVDTHKDVHVAAVISGVGALLGTRDFPATAAGYRALLTWARTFGAVPRAGVEGTSSYGAALNRMLRREAVTVIEVNRPDRADRRRRGKTDATDAEAAARAVLSGRATAVAKTGDGPVEIVRMFKLAKSSAVKSRTQAINQLKAVLVGTNPALREQLSGLSTPLFVRACAALEVTDPTADTGQAARHTLRLLAQRITLLTEEIDDLDARLTAVLADHAPDLLARNGVGPDTGATLLSPPLTTPTGSTPRLPSPPSAGSARSRHPPARPSAAGSTVAATDRPTPPCTASPSPACGGTPPPAPTSNAASGTARPDARRSAASSDTSPESSTHCSPRPRASLQAPPSPPLDIHRGIKHALTYRGGVVLAAVLAWLG
jgi:transposase